MKNLARPALHALAALTLLLTLPMPAQAQDNRVNLLTYPEFGSILERKEQAYLEFWTIKPTFNVAGEAKIGKFSLGSNEEAKTFVQFDFTDKGTFSVSPRSRITLTPGKKYKLTYRIKASDEALLKLETHIVQFDADKKKIKLPAFPGTVSQEWQPQTVEWTAPETALDADFTISVIASASPVSVSIADPFLEEVAAP